MDFAGFLKAVRSPALQAVIAHWRDARDRVQMPSWEQIDPSRIAPHLSIVWAYRYDQPSGQFVGRLAGNGVGWGSGKNFRGTPLAELWPGAAGEAAHKAMLRAISEPAIYRVAGGLFKHAGRTIEGERIALPLAGDGLNGDGVLGASVYQHPLRTLEAGPAELLSGTKEWFSLS
jgi:hypothetical protein